MTQETLDCLVHNLNQVGMFLLFLGALVGAIVALMWLGMGLSNLSDRYDDWRSWAYPVLIAAALVLIGTVIYTLATC